MRVILSAGSAIFIRRKSEWERTMIGKQDRILQTRPINLDFMFALCMSFCVALGS